LKQEGNQCSNDEKNIKIVEFEPNGIHSNQTTKIFIENSKHSNKIAHTNTNSQTDNHDY